MFRTISPASRRLILGGCLAPGGFLLGTTSRAQEPPAAPVISTVSEVATPGPAPSAPTAPAPILTGIPAAAPFAASGQPGTFEVPATPAKVELTTREVIRESIFGAADEKDWKPLTLDTFFTEG